MFSAGKSGGVIAPADPYFQDVTLLLTGDGTNGAQNNTFIDSSSNNFTITRNGNTTQGSFSPYGNLWSNYFGGSSYLTTSSSVGATSVTTTVEYWAFTTVNSSTAMSILGENGTGFLLGIENDRPSAWFNATCTIVSGFTNTLDGGADSRAVKGSTAVTLNSWHHFAWVFSVGGSTTTATLYVDGASYGSFTFSNVSKTIAAIGSFAVGAGYPRYYTGYVSNIRITNSAVYTSAFTPSTTPLTAITNTSLLTCQSNRFIDNSSNNFALTVNGTPSVQRFSPFQPTSAYSTSVIGGSGYFDGSGDYLSTANVSSLSANFTVECWVYYTAAPNNNTFISSIDNTGAGNWNFYYNSSVNALRIVGTSAKSYIQSGTLPITPVANSWVHFAASRSGSTVYWWVNGVSAGTTTDSTNWTGSATSTRIGIDLTDSFAFTGYISSLRVVLGTAIYTTAFTPPTSPLTAVSGTWLLTNMTNAGIPDAAMMNDLETVGNAQVSTSVKKYGTGSLYFDGTGDWLVTPNRTNLNVGSGDFTVEAWIYTGSTSQQCIIGANRNSDGVGAWMFNINYTGKARFFCMYSSGTVLDYNVGTGTISDSTWHHIAVTRNGSSLRIFVDGSQVGTTNTTLGTASIDNASADYRVGSTTDSGLNFNGYIDDLRITKGYARYTSNFTPTTASLPTY